MERPAKYGNREFLTDEETKQAFDAGVHESFDGGAVGNGDEEDPTSADYDFKTYGLTPWQEGVRPNNRTSLVVDPPDGRIPPLTAAAKARRAAGVRQGGFASYFTQETQVGELKNGRVHADTAHDLDLGVQCVALQAGPPIGLGGGYNKGLFIVQGKDSRLPSRLNTAPKFASIPIGTRPHPSSGIRQWHADGVAHWDGDTLVVEDTNFRPDNVFRGASPDTLKITEYFKRLGPEQIEYKYTVDDPSTWTQAVDGYRFAGTQAIQGPFVGIRLAARTTSTPYRSWLGHATPKRPRRTRPRREFRSRRNNTTHRKQPGASVASRQGARFFLRRRKSGGARFPLL